MQGILVVAGYFFMIIGIITLIVSIVNMNLMEAAVSLCIIFTSALYFAINAILDRLEDIEMHLAGIKPIGVIPTEYADQFSVPEDTDGQAVCIICKKAVPKSELLYNKSMDVYCHRNCI